MIVFIFVEKNDKSIGKERYTLLALARSYLRTQGTVT